MSRRRSTTTEETRAIAKELASEYPDCPAYYLDGELGAGKTVFAKGIAEFYGVDPEIVVSPTFALVNRYSGKSRDIYHIDLYRLEDEDERELDELGLYELEEEGALLVVEWANKLGRHRNPDATVVRFHVAGEHDRELDILRPPRPT